jgi:hypothetical protein
MSNRSAVRIATMAPAVVAVTACLGIRVGNTAPQHKFPPTCAEAVIAYESYSKVPNNYYEIALITAEGNAVWTDDDEMVLRMKQRAASVGANGMVVDALGTSATTVQLIGAAIGTGDADRKGRAVAIHMPAHVERARATCQRAGS